MVGPHCCDCLKPNKAAKHIDIYLLSKPRSEN